MYEKEAGVYKLTHIPSGKYYIGGTRDLYNRKYTHFSFFRQENRTMNAAMQKLWDECPSERMWKYEVLQYCKDTKEELNRCESRYIQAAFSDDQCLNGYNAAYRPRWGIPNSDQHKENHAASMCKRNGRRSSTVTLVSPDGDEHVVSNISGFAKAHDLHQPILNQVALGIRTHHKGWALKGTEIMNKIKPTTIGDFKGNVWMVDKDNWQHVARETGVTDLAFRAFVLRNNRHAIEPGLYKIGMARWDFLLENEVGQIFIVPDLNGAKRVFCLHHNVTWRTWSFMSAKKRLASGEFFEGWRIIDQKRGRGWNG